MIRPLILAALPVAVWALHPSPAWPQSRDVYVIEPGEDDGSVAWIIHQNNWTRRGEYQFTFDVEGYGEIVLVLTVHPNSEPDTVTVIDWPPGLAVIPDQITTEESERNVLKVWRTGA